jgi:hypothetical protein
VNLAFAHAIEGEMRGLNKFSLKTRSLERGLILIRGDK